MSIRYLKNLTLGQVTLFAGTTSNTTTTFKPGELKIYESLVVDYDEDPNYNKPLFDRYISQNILTLLTLPDAIPFEPPTPPPGPVGLQFLIIQAPGNILQPVAPPQ